MDQTVEEVFETMLGVPCSTEARAGTAPEITARVGFSGALEGECRLSLPASSATRLAEAFLGEAEHPPDAGMTADAAGELCNMLAGGWKRRLGAPHWAAELSVPAVGADTGERQVAESSVNRVYEFDGAPFAVDLTIVEDADAQ